MSNLSLSTDSISTLNSTSSYSSQQERSRTSSFVSVGSDDNDIPKSAQGFHKEATDSIFDSLKRGDEAANIQLELNALRLGTNASEHQVRRAVTQAFMKHISALIDAGTPAAEAVKLTLTHLKELVRRTMFDRGDDHDVKADQIDFMLLVQADAMTRKDGDVLLLHVATKLVELDVVEAEGIEQWWNDGKSSESEGLSTVREKTRQLVEYLAESDEEDSESGEEESSEEE
jgi:hypothetical protein